MRRTIQVALIGLLMLGFVAGGAYFLHLAAQDELQYSRERMGR